MVKELNKYKYRGVIHIHTTCSDGTEDINSISKAAKKAGLDWIIVTDHNNFDVEEGFINGVYVIKGEEISPTNGNHYLALGINQLILPDEDCQKNTDAVRDNGGFGFAAHPDESETRKNNFPPIKWHDKNIIPDGVEIWNWFSQWGDNYCDKNIFCVIYSYLFRKNLTKKPHWETLDWWNLLNKNSDKIIPAIGSADAHALKISKYIIPVTIFPYKYLFKTIVNELQLKEPLSKNFETAKEQILTAIKSGHNIISNVSVCKHIPKITVSNNNAVFSCGEIIILDTNTYINVKSKICCDINIYINGEKIHSSKTKNLIFKIEKAGKYRVEVEKHGRGIAYSNPISVQERLEN